MGKGLAGYVVAGAASLLVAGAAHLHVSQGTELLKDEYIQTSRAEANRGAASVDNALRLIYQNLRTLASLPGIRSIDRHADNLTPEARATFQMIYNNLASSVSVSEVYVIPADFDPERIDPRTNAPEAPIIMFDELILNAGSGLSQEARAANPKAVADAEKSGPPEVEIHEYRQLAQQSDWFRRNFPGNDRITGLRVPIISGPEVITCDNTDYVRTRKDADRSGIIFSVPFFDEAGHYKGMVSAIMLTSALAKLLPDSNFALVNEASGFVAMKPEAVPHMQDAATDIASAQPSKHLLFSQVNPLTLSDPRSTWAVWTGYDDRRFYGGSEYRALQSLRYYGFGLALVLLIAGCLTWFFITRDIRSSKQAALRLAHARDEARRAEAEARGLAGQLQVLNDDISRLNRDLTDKVKLLQEAQDEIIRKGKMAQLGQLTATIAHELRNPMGSIRTTAFLLKRKTAATVPGIEPLLQRIDTGIQRCDGIITQLLDFARTKSPDLSITPVDQWLAETIEEEAQAIPESVAVVCDLGLGGLDAAFDQGRMRRVIVNLLSNASEALVGKPGSAPTRATANPSIRVMSRLSERGIEITVTDNGPGMDSETLARVREPLFTTKSFGTGLGIPAVERILELHGGGLDIRSRPGEGASFTAWFPVAAVQAKAA